MIWPADSKSQAHPTIWGLTPTQLHDHFWASRGVHVVRQGERDKIPSDAEQYLLTDPRTLATFRLRGLIETLSWVRPDVLFVRLNSILQSEYRENALCDADDQFVGFQRSYGGYESRFARLVLTRHREFAEIWQTALDTQSAWRMLRSATRHQRREVASVKGRAYDRSDGTAVAQFVRELVQVWGRPASTVNTIQSPSPGVWIPHDGRIDPAIRMIGPVWVGAGRQLSGDGTVIGPTILWDDPVARPAPRTVAWDAIEPTDMPMLRPIKPRRKSTFYGSTKRAFDIVFAAFVLLLTLPLYPLVILAIWLEDRGPAFFAHSRESIGGAEFPCLKFRSMRMDADRLKAQLVQHNQADGPQFFVDFDPRITRVGRFLRKTNLDELPQFINVLLGHMSVVGPRPSPRKENQFCPPWREARLSVRPGVTGLWQVRRTRRQGLDFQEWIRFDIEYVETASWGLDLNIVCRTFGVLLGGVIRG